jgi:hypothetical protein
MKNYLQILSSYLSVSEIGEFMEPTFHIYICGHDHVVKVYGILVTDKLYLKMLYRVHLVLSGIQTHNISGDTH